MKIVIINASPRKTGTTGKILEEFTNQLKPHGSIDFFHLSDLRIDYCKGCCSCYRTGQCFLDDDVEMLSRKIAEADGLIIGSPTYASGVPGLLKSFIDRGHFVIEQLLKNTFTLSVVTYENADGSSVLKVLKKLYVLSGARNIDKLMLKLPFNANPLDSTHIQIQIAKKSRRFLSAIKSQASGSIIDRFIHAVAFHIAIKPLVLKKGDAYQGVLYHWKKKGISY